MSAEIDISDSRLRWMRDLVFGHATTDTNWNACRDKWRDDLPWLLDHYEKVKMQAVKIKI